MAAETQPRRAVITTTGAVTVRISDYTLASYTDIILQWDPIVSTKLDPITYGTFPATASFVVQNNVTVGGQSRFSDIAGLVFAEIEIYQNAVKVFSGTIEDSVNISHAEVLIKCIGMDAELSKKFDHEIIDETVFANADPDDVGKMLPQPYGQAKRVPFLAIDVGVLTTLKTTIATAESTDDIELTETSALPASGTVQIGSEKISYTSKNNTTKVLTGTITRGVSGTTAVMHYAGAVIGEVRSEYVFAAGCPVNAIDAVYVGEVLQDASEYTTYTGQTGDEHTTYSGRGVISFSNLSLIQRGGSTEGNVISYARHRRAAGLPIGGVTHVDKNGVVNGFDESVTITFPSEPGGTTSDIYVDYYFDCNFFWLPEGIMPAWDMTNMSEGGFDFFIDGVLVAKLKGSAEPALTVYESSPLRVSKAAWPTTATKTKTFRHSSYGTVSLVVAQAIAYCTSSIPETDERGKKIFREATNLPVGKILTNTTFDASTTITFPSAPSGNLTDVYIQLDWAWASRGDDILSDKPRMYEIDSTPVYHVAAAVNQGLADSREIAVLPTTLYLPQTSWQTTLSKTISRLSEFNRGEEFVITSATQHCYTDDFSNDVSLTGNSVADSIIGGGVFADVDGFQDTNSPPVLIEYATDIMQHIIETQCGKTSACDTTTHTAVRASLVSAGYVEAVALLQPPDIRARLAGIALQSKCIQWFWNDIHYVKFMSGTYVADAVISYGDIYQNQSWINYTNKAFISNDLTAQFNHYWWGYADENTGQNTVESADAGSPSSQNTYGELKKNINLPYVPGSTQAQAVLDWRLSDFKDPRLIVEFIGTLTNNINRQVGQIVTFDTTNTDLNNQLAGLVASTDKFLITNVTFQNNGAIRIETIGL